jgi:hypothetical protein
MPAEDPLPAGAAAGQFGCHGPDQWRRCHPSEELIQ